jgi:hypothetical protein
MKLPLGKIEVEVMDQPWAYLTHELQDTALRVFANFDELDSPESLVTFLGGGVFDFLAAFYPDEIPSLMPRHEFEGFATETAYKAGQYDREWARKNGPTFPQIVAALQAALEINGGDDFKRLIGLLPPKWRGLAKDLAGAMFAESRSTSSLSSPLASGESDQTISGDDVPLEVGMTEESPSLA